MKLSWSLLNSRTRRRCQSDPGVFRDEIGTRGIRDGLVIIDEIQKVPELLDEVHLLIEETDIRFLLTGSSARRLKEQGVNLLGGRAGKMDPDFRRKGIASMLLEKALQELDRNRDITVSTFREDDEKGRAPRALYKKFGFKEGELTVKFGYPNQVLVL